MIIENAKTLMSTWTVVLVKYVPSLVSTDEVLNPNRIKRTAVTTAAITLGTIILTHLPKTVSPIDSHYILRVLNALLS